MRMMVHNWQSAYNALKAVEVEALASAQGLFLTRALDSDCKPIKGKYRIVHEHSGLTVGPVIRGLRIAKLRLTALSDRADWRGDVSKRLGELWDVAREVFG